MPTATMKRINSTRMAVEPPIMRENPRTALRRSLCRWEEVVESLKADCEVRTGQPPGY